MHILINFISGFVARPWFRDPTKFQRFIVTVHWVTPLQNFDHASRVASRLSLKLCILITHHDLILVTWNLAHTPNLTFWTKLCPHFPEFLTQPTPGNPSTSLPTTRLPVSASICHVIMCHVTKIRIHQTSSIDCSSTGKTAEDQFGTTGTIESFTFTSSDESWRSGSGWGGADQTGVIDYLETYWIRLVFFLKI